jgi:hypothetical protein
MSLRDQGQAPSLDDKGFVISLRSMYHSALGLATPESLGEVSSDRKGKNTCQFELMETVTVLAKEDLI